MPSIGARCHELRLPDADKTWRIVYRIDSDAIVILEVFAKKSASTPKRSSTSVSNDSGTTTVDKVKRKSLRARGWKVGSTQEFLGLNDEEVAIIEMKLALGRSLKARRQRKRLSQTAFAQRINSSQSRVAKMEAGDVSVSLDLLIRSLLALGVSRQELANAIVQSTKKAA